MSVKINQFGDTIIEVMLSITIIGMVLGASYATANRALRTGRMAQEQTEALKLAESQVEKLKYMASLFNPDSVVTGTIFDNAVGSTDFCIDDSFAKVLTSDATYAAKCKGISGLYDLTVNYDNAANLYKVVVTWDTPTGIKGNVQVSYRLFP